MDTSELLNMAEDQMLLIICFKQLYRKTPSATFHIINIEKNIVVINCHSSVVCNKLHV